MLSFVSSPLASRYMLRDALAGAISRKSTNVERPSANRISMKPPPPRLPANGCVAAIAKPIATAASTALPPFCRTATPTSTACDSIATAMPCRARTGWRAAWVGTLTSSSRTIAANPPARRRFGETGSVDMNTSYRICLGGSMIRRRLSTTIAVLAVATLTLQAGSTPQRARLGMVITQSDIASQIGFKVIQSGGNAIDAAVATAFALAVTHPTAGNIGGGGFIVFRPATGEPMSFDFREVGPARSSPEMWLKDGKYDSTKHHNSHLSVGVPGTVAGLHLAWKEQGSKPWKELLQPAITMARDGFEISHGLA